MLGTLTPLGERGRKVRWEVTAALYILGSAFGGAAVAALLGLVGLALAEGVPGFAHFALATLAAVAVAMSLVDLKEGHSRLPHFRRQVDDLWLTRFRRWVYATGFGVQLGGGVFTHVVSAVTYAAFAAAVLSGSVTRGMLIGLVYGGMRGATILFSWRASTTDRLLRLHARLDEAQARARQLANGMKFACSGALIVIAATGFSGF